jgi:hypothetical protein
VPHLFYSQSLNRYSYVYNNPIIFIDPSGHSGTLCAEGTSLCFNGGTNQTSGSLSGTGCSSCWTSPPPLVCLTNSSCNSNNNSSNVPLSAVTGLPSNSCNNYSSCNIPSVPIITGLPSNSCINSSCTSSANNKPSSGFICPPYTSCQYNLSFGNYTYDLWAIYWSAGVSASTTIPGPSNSLVTISNDGGEFDHFGFESDYSSFNVNSTTFSIGLGGQNYINYTTYSGYSFDQFAVNWGFEADYSINPQGPLDFSGTTSAEMGVRPIRLGMVVLPIYSSRYIALWVLQQLAGPSIPVLGH